MKKIENVRAREAARVLLIQSRSMSEIAREKLLSASPGNLRVDDDFRRMLERLDCLLAFTVDDQATE